MSLLPVQRLVRTLPYFLDAILYCLHDLRMRHDHITQFVTVKTKATGCFNNLSMPARDEQQ